jgi:plastocyanin
VEEAVVTPETEEPVEEPVTTPQEEETPAVEEPVEESEVTVEPAQNNVSIPQGASSPGCDATDECFIPSSITVSVGTTVTWTNDDSAAHTVTSGQDATFDGIFDSSLFMAGRTFSYTFEDAGTYPYFCFVHPWMKGTVTVE